MGMINIRCHQGYRQQESSGDKNKQEGEVIDDNLRVCIHLINSSYIIY